MVDFARYLPMLVFFALVAAFHLSESRRWLRAGGRGRGWRRAVALAAGLAVALILAGAALGFTAVVRRVPPGAWVAWTRAAAIAWSLVSAGLFAAAWLWRRSPAFSPGRRLALRSAAAAALGAPPAACGLGVYVARTQIGARQVEARIAGLPPDLDGLRIAQLTDIHFGAFLGARELARAVGLANEWRPHLAAVTGDFITDRGDPLDDCLRGLALLRASEGVYACCGNHEAYARAEAYCAVRGARLGIHMLRGRSRLLRFGAALLNLAGVDHQRDRQSYLAGADRLLAPGAFNLLLSHNPDVFPVAVRQGFQIVLAGHTHGGQLAMELAGTSLNISRLFTPYVHGLYRRAGSLLYVSRGIGTVGVPMRLGAAPEVTLIRLHRA